jgi:hypothetical protein
MDESTTDAPAPAPGFRARRTGSLGAAELGPGDVEVSIEGGALVVTGADGRRFVTPFGAIGRLRLSRLPNAGLNPSRRRYYRLAVWRGVGAAPMILWPDWQAVEAFHEVVRPLAAGVLAASGSGSVQSGISWPRAALSSLWLFIALVIVLDIGSGQFQWHPSPAAMAGVGVGLAVVVGLSTWFDIARPRRLGGPDDLEWVLKY